MSLDTKAIDEFVRRRVPRISPDKLRHYQMLIRRGVPAEHAARLATGYLFGVGLKTDTTFMAGRGDGVPDDPLGRGVAIQKARAAGVTSGFYSEQLGQWIQSRGDVERICREKGHGCHGSVNIPLREPETDPWDVPYKVADDLVETAVAETVEREYEGQATPKQVAELKEATAERLAGDTSKGRSRLL